MTTKYQVDKYSIHIKPLDVVHETDKFVTIRYVSAWNGKVSETRTAKISDYHRIFDTEIEARTFLIHRTERHLHSLRTQIRMTEERLKILNSDADLSNGTD